MFKLKKIRPEDCKGFYTKDINEHKGSKCIKCGWTREYHKKDLAYLLRR